MKGSFTDKGEANRQVTVDGQAIDQTSVALSFFLDPPAPRL